MCDTYFLPVSMLASIYQCQLDSYWFFAMFLQVACLLVLEQNPAALTCCFKGEPEESTQGPPRLHTTGRSTAARAPANTVQHLTEKAWVYISVSDELARQNHSLFDIFPVSMFLCHHHSMFHCNTAHQAVTNYFGELILQSHSPQNWVWDSHKCGEPNGTY